MATDVEILARQITNQVLTINAGAGRTIGDLTNNDASGSIYQSWINICTPLVPWINTHGSGSSGSGSIWGQITGTLSNQTDLYTNLNSLQNQITLVSGSLPDKENISNKSTNTNLGTSNIFYPTQNAVKTYVDNNAGESNTASNVGIGEGDVFKQKLGVDLQFKTLKAGSNIILTNNPDEVLITAISGGVLASGSAIWGQIIGTLSDQVDLYYELTSLSGSITTEIQDRITEDNNLQNQITLISGSLLDKEDTANKSTNTNLGISNILYPSQNAVKVYVDTQILASSSTSTGSNLGIGEGLYINNSGSILQFKSLIAGNNVSLTSDSNSITINSSSSSTGSLTTAVNLGTGEGLYTTNSGSVLQFKSLVAGDNIGLVSTDTELQIHKLSEDITSRIVTFSTASVFETETVTNPKIATLSNNYFIVTYTDLGNTTGYARVGYLQSGSVFYGDRYIFDQKDSITNLFVTMLDSNKVVVNYRSNAPYSGYLKVLTTSGSVITSSGSAYTYGNSPQGYSILKKVDTDKIVITYVGENAAPPYLGVSKIGTVSGSVITYGSASIFADNYTNIWWTEVINSNLLITGYINLDSSPNYTYLVKAGTVSGTLITYGTAAIVDNTPIIEEVNISKINDTECVTLYDYSTGRLLKSKVLKIQNNNIIIGNETVVTSYGNDVGDDISDLVLNKVSTNIFCASYSTYPVSSSIYDVNFVLGRLQNEILEYDSIYTVLTSSTSPTAYKDICSLNGDKSIIVYSDVTDTYKGKYILSNYEIPNIEQIQNTGTGEGSIHKTTFNNIAYLKTIKAGSNITIINNSDDITINSTSSSSVATGSNLGIGEGLYINNSGSILQFKSLIAGNNVSLTSNSNSITINSTVSGSISGSITTASNIGTGEGEVYSSTSGSTLQFKTIKAGSNITVTNNANDITINSIASGSSNTLWGQISGSIVDQVDLQNVLNTKISTIREDTFPQLGGRLNLNNYPLIDIFTAGENLASGNVCYLNSDSKFYKANAITESKTKGFLILASESIAINATGSFIIQGNYYLSGLTAGTTYYLDTITSGSITSILPSGSGQQVRIVGYALSTSSLYFKPSDFYLEIL